jgi:hypothetical protein
MVTYYKLTKRQRLLLRRLFDEGGAYLYGPDVTVARRLEKFGLVTIEDNGAFSPFGSDDGERWEVELTAPGCGVAGNLDADGNICPEVPA